MLDRKAFSLEPQKEHLLEHLERQKKLDINDTEVVERPGPGSKGTVVQETCGDCCHAQYYGLA